MQLHLLPRRGAVAFIGRGLETSRTHAHGDDHADGAEGCQEMREHRREEEELGAVASLAAGIWTLSDRTG